MDDAAALDRRRPAIAAETVEPHTPLNDVEGLSEADLAHWDETGQGRLGWAIRLTETASGLTRIRRECGDVDQSDDLRVVASARTDAHHAGSIVYASIMALEADVSHAVQKVIPIPLPADMPTKADGDRG